MSRAIARKRCKAKTAAGKRCKAWPLQGGELCLAHDVKARELARFSGAQPGAGRPKLPKPSDLQRHLLEQHITDILAPLYRTIGFDIVTTPEGLALQARPTGGVRLHGTSQKDGRST